jgi:Fic family protein
LLASYFYRFSKGNVGTDIVFTVIENSKESYYVALYDSSIKWHENKNDYAIFVRYYLGILQKAYHAFEERVMDLQQKGVSKPERVKAVIDRQIGKVTKQELIESCPDISKATIERTLTSLVKSGYLVKIGGGRSVAYGKTDKQN